MIVIGGFASKTHKKMSLKILVFWAHFHVKKFVYFKKILYLCTC